MNGTGKRQTEYDATAPRVGLAPDVAALSIGGQAPMEREAKLAAARVRDKRYRDSHPGQSRARQRVWPWRKAFGAVKQARRSARKHGVPPGTLTKEIMARLHLLPCAYCGCMPAGYADHIVPFRYGGLNELSNMAPSCDACNKRRGAYVMNAVQGKTTTPEFRIRRGVF